MTDSYPFAKKPAYLAGFFFAGFFRLSLCGSGGVLSIRLNTSSIGSGLGGVMSRPLSSYGVSGAVFVGNTGFALKDCHNVAIRICNSGDYPLEAHPRLLQLAMRVISAWSILDTYVARTFAEMVGGRADPAIAMYESLGSTNTQHTALKAAARAVLNRPQLDLLAALLGLYSKRATFRNRVAHHLWGFSSAAPNGVILLDPRIYADQVEGRNDVDYTKIPVFEEGDFTERISGIEQLSAYFHDFYFMLGPHKSLADELLARLMSEPPIQTELSRDTRRSQNAQAASTQPLTPPNQGDVP